MTNPDLHRVRLDFLLRPSGPPRMTGVRNLPSPGSYREADDAMARMTLEQIKARHPAIDRRKLEATTEEDIARHMVEDGEMQPAPGPAGKQMKR